jgi:hypothetical protein
MTLEQFAETHLHKVAGASVLVKEAGLLFRNYLPRNLRAEVGKVAFSRALWALGYQTGYGHANKTFVLNTSFDPAAVPTAPLVLTRERQIRRPPN